MDRLSLALDDEAATAALGARLAPLIRAGDAVGLTGPLGAGKTTLARAILAPLAGVEEAPSPTFPLVLAYEGRAFPVWHFDLYRLERREDLRELGFEEALASGAALIEWPERLGPLFPDHALLIRLDPEGARRRARFAGGGDWPARLRAAGLG